MNKIDLVEKPRLRDDLPEFLRDERNDRMRQA